MDKQEAVLKPPVRRPSECGGITLSNVFEYVYLGVIVGITLLSLYLKDENPSFPPGIGDMDAVERANLRLPYVAAFGVSFCATIGCIVKAVSTNSTRKASLATRLAVHIGIAGFAMLLCALDWVWILHGEAGHRINLVAQGVWFLTSASMALLFHKMAYYSVGMSANADDQYGPMLISSAALLREGVTVLARLFPRPQLLPLFSLTVVFFVGMSLYVKGRVMAPYFASTAGYMDRRIMLVSLMAIFIAMGATDVAFLAYAAGYIDCLTSDCILCGCITIRCLLLYVRCTVVMLYDDERAVAAAQIIEERLALQQQHEEQRRQLYRVIFHELRVPLNSIVLGLDLTGAAVSSTPRSPNFTLERHELAEVDTVNMMREAAANMMTILSDLLDIAKIEARAFVLRAGVFSIQRLLDTVKRDLTPLALAKNVEVSCAVDMDIPKHVVGDFARLSQVLANFLSNAIKFCPHDGTGRVLLRASRASSSVGGTESQIPIELACIDNGEGIAPEEMRQLFQLFSQLENATTLNIRGSGLGLAICSQIAEMHGGKIGCSSEVGCGSKFYVVIPFERAAHPESQCLLTTGSSDTESVEEHAVQRPEPVRASPTIEQKQPDEQRSTITGIELNVSPQQNNNLARIGRPNSKSPEDTVPMDAGEATPNADPSDNERFVRPLRVLVVDDDATNRMLLSRSMKKRLPRGSIIDEACDGREALTASLAATYDVICVDGRMPVMDGNETVAAMRSSGVTSLIIGCTANTLLEDQDAFKAAGADEVCTKPIRVDDIIHHIRVRHLLS